MSHCLLCTCGPSNTGLVLLTESHSNAGCASCPAEMLTVIGALAQQRHTACYTAIIQSRPLTLRYKCYHTGMCPAQYTLTETNSSGLDYQHYESNVFTVVLGSYMSASASIIWEVISMALNAPVLTFCSSRKTNKMVGVYTFSNSVDIFR